MATGIVMILSAILTTTALTILALTNVNSPRDARYQFVHSAFRISQANIYAFGQNTNAWKATVAHNKSRGRMACINNSTMKCTARVYEPIDLRLPSGAAAGAEYYNYYAGPPDGGVRDGFGLNGAPFNFKKSKITNGCIFGVQLRWWPYCGPTDCYIWPEKVSFQWVYDVPNTDQAGYAKSHRNFFVPINLIPLEGDIVSGNQHR
jgi:hypothetical protein